VIEEAADNVAERESTAVKPEERVLEKMTADLERESRLLTKLSAEQIRLVLEDVCSDMLSGLEVLAVRCFLSLRYL